jgi:hypothetical protein
LIRLFTRQAVGRLLNNSFFRHSGPRIKYGAGFDKPAPACPKPGESRKSLKTLDPPVKPGDDDIRTFVSFCKGLVGFSA